MKRFESFRSVFLVTYIVLMLALTCACQGMRSGGASRPADASTAAPASTSNKPPIPEINVEENFDADYVQQLLSSGQTLPLMVLTYAEPGNTDITLVGEIIHHADTNATVDRDLARERTFTDYPYTIESYLISVNSPQAYNSIIEAQTRYPLVKMVVFPVYKIELKSYLRLNYSKPLFKEAVTKNIWIGESPTTRYPADGNLEDPSGYIPMMGACDEFNSHCFAGLLQNHYFSHRVLMDDKITPPLQFLDTELGSTLSLLQRGYTGDDSLSGSIMSLAMGKTLLRNVTLVHEVWARGPAPVADPADVLFKVEGFEHHPVVVHNQANNEYFYELPVTVTESGIPLRIRNTPSKMTELFEQMRKQITSNLGEQL